MVKTQVDDVSHNLGVVLILTGIVLFSLISVSPTYAQSNLVFAFDTIQGKVDTVIRDYVSGKGWQVIQVSRPLTLQYLVDNKVKVLHLSQFKTVFTDQEIRELKEYVDSGGIIMLAAWSPTKPYWLDLTRGFGITFDKEIVQQSDGTWRAEVANHPLLDGVKFLNVPQCITALNVESPSKTLVSTRHGSNTGAIIALYESTGKLLVYPAQGGTYYSSCYSEGEFSLSADNYLLLGNALRWFGQTETVTPKYVTTTTETRTTTSVSTVTQTTTEMRTTTSVRTVTQTTTETVTRLTTTTTSTPVYITTTSTTTTTTATPVFMTTTSVSTTTKTTPMYFTTTSVTTFVTTSIDYANRAIVINGSTFVLSSEVLAGIAALFLLATAGLFLMIRRTVGKANQNRTS